MRSARAKFDQAAAKLAREMAANPMVRAVNFHSTPRERAAEYRTQLAKLSHDFAPVTEDDLNRYLATGRWHKPKPGIIVAIYEGYRNGYDVMRPLGRTCQLAPLMTMERSGMVRAPRACRCAADRRSAPGRRRARR